MTGKVKLTREQAEVFDRLAKEGWHHEGLIKTHTEDPEGWMEICEPLRDIPLLKFVDALRIGYEVEVGIKIGDWIKDEHGHVCKVTDMRDDKVWGYWNDVNVKQYAHVNKVSLLSPEEIEAEKERRVWAKFGRKVREFKLGDILLMHNYAPIIVSGITDHWDNGFASIETAKKLYNEGRLDGFHPTESFILFGGGEDA